MTCRSFFDALAGAGGDEQRAGQRVPQPGQRHLVGGVDLVHHDDLRHRQRVDLAEHLADRRDLLLRVLVGAVHHVQQQVGVGDLLERGAEGLDQLMRQVPDEADGVGQGEDPAVGGAGSAGGRVEGGEQRVLDQHPGVGQPVEQRGLARVGVAGDRAPPEPRWPGAATAWCRGPGASRSARDLQLGDALVDAAAVDLELGLTGTAGADAGAGGHPATALPGQRRAPAT